MPLTGVQSGLFKGWFQGYLDADFDGVMRGVFIGEMVGYFCGTMNGEYHGVIGGVQFDGPINQYVCDDISGTFAGIVDGTFNGAIFRGHLIGFLDATIDAQIDGDTTATFNGTIDGRPTDTDFPARNTSSELPDTLDGFPPFRFTDLPFTGGSGLPDPGTDALPPADVLIYYPNDLQSYTITCEDLTDYTYSVAAGLFESLIPGQANIEALAFAVSQAEFYCINSFVLPLITNTAQTCSVTCASGGTVSYTQAAGKVSRTSLAEANSVAMQNACLMVNLLCVTAPPERDEALPPGGMPPGGGPTRINGQENPPPTRPAISYANAAQTASSVCPNGGTFSYTVPGVRFFAPSYDAANALALSYAQNQTITSRFCIDQTSIATCLSIAGSNTLSLFGDNSYPINWTATNLPPGVTLSDAGTNGRSMLLSGTPGASGVYQVGLTASYVQESVASGEARPVGAISTLVKTIPFYIGDITTTALPEGSVGVPYSKALVGVGFDPASLWAIDGGTFPDDFELNPITGVISGTPTVDGAYNFTASRGGCTKDLALLIVAECITDDSALPDGVVGTAYSTTLTAPALIAPMTWVVLNGTVPDGTELGEDSGEIFGVPTIASPFSFQVQVTDVNGLQCLKNFTIAVTNPGCITNDTELADGFVDIVYSVPLLAPTLVAPLIWSVFAGTLPDGLTLIAGTGVIGGTPTTEQTRNLTVKVIDALLTECTKDFTISIAEECEYTITPSELVGMVLVLSGPESKAWASDGTALSVSGKATLASPTLRPFLLEFYAWETFFGEGVFSAMPSFKVDGEEIAMELIEINATNRIWRPLDRDGANRITVLANLCVPIIVEYSGVAVNDDPTNMLKLFVN